MDAPRTTPVAPAATSPSVSTVTPTVKAAPLPYIPRNVVRHLPPVSASPVSFFRGDNMFYIIVICIAVILIVLAMHFFTKRNQNVTVRPVIIFPDGVDIRQQHPRAHEQEPAPSPVSKKSRKKSVKFQDMDE